MVGCCCFNKRYSIFNQIESGHYAGYLEQTRFVEWFEGERGEGGWWGGGGVGMVT